MISARMAALSAELVRVADELTHAVYATPDGRDCGPVSIADAAVMLSAVDRAGGLLTVLAETLAADLERRALHDPEIAASGDRSGATVTASIYADQAAEALGRASLDAAHAACAARAAVDTTTTTTRGQR